jgi:hypothetical protein
MFNNEVLTIKKFIDRFSDYGFLGGKALQGGIYFLLRRTVLFLGIAVFGATSIFIAFFQSLFSRGR